MKNPIRSFFNRFRKSKIERDLFEVCANINAIEKGTYENFEVRKPNYLKPELTETILPLGHPDGLFKYYLRVWSGLEMSLHLGVSPEKHIRKTSFPRYVLNYAQN